MARRRMGCHSFDRKVPAAASPAPSASGRRGRGRAAVPPRGGAGRRRRAASDPFVVKEAYLCSISRMEGLCFYIDPSSYYKNPKKNTIGIQERNSVFITQSILSCVENEEITLPTDGACPSVMAMARRPAGHLCQSKDISQRGSGDEDDAPDSGRANRMLESKALKSGSLKRDKVSKRE